MTKGIVVALVAGLALAGCKSKDKAKTDEPPAAGSGTAAASGAPPAPAPTPTPEPGSGSGGRGSAISVTAVTACVRYAACRAEKDPDQSGVAAYQAECTESWQAMAGADRTKIDTCVKTTKGCEAQLKCFADMPGDD